MPKKNKKQRAPRGLKKNFVEALPLEMPTADVVAKGKAEGVELNTHQVSNIRWLLKQKAGTPKQPKGPRARTKRTGMADVANVNRLAVANNAGRLSAASAHADQTRWHAMRNMVVQIGLIRARQILDEIEDPMAGAPQRVD